MLLSEFAQKNSAENSRLLFLDDIRFPFEVYEYTNQPLFLQEKWEIIRNYNGFVEWITKNGLPDFISFDHDLADISFHTEKTGYECAKWLVDYCLDNNLACPNFYCHSMNPVGRDKINGLLMQFSAL
jgi:hypothetical protein